MLGVNCTPKQIEVFETIAMLHELACSMEKFEAIKPFISRGVEPRCHSRRAGGRIRSEYLPFRTRVLYRPSQHDRRCVMFDGARIVACEVFCTARVTNEGGRIRFEYLPFQMRVLYRLRRNDRHRVMIGTSLYRYHTAIDLLSGMGLENVESDRAQSRGLIWKFGGLGAISCVVHVT
ncbi:hypothetical protein TNCV_3973611 [Trichonephila clavipes]|nr:hypothetical protein TNCV_3973611 [Trichonephila clavipes]